MYSVFLNPGHDRDLDSGAVSPSTGLREADYAWDISQLVQKYLVDAGVKVFVMQSDDLAYVCETADNDGVDLVVSVHCNASESHTARGTEVEVYSQYSEGLKAAQHVLDQIVDSVGTIDRGVREHPEFYMLNHVDAPAILIEIAFIDEPNDEYILVHRKDDIARAIARGITDYFRYDR